MPTPNARPPILFLHSVFGRPSLMDAWVQYFTDAGFECHVPAMPGREPTDEAVLTRTGIDDCYEVALAAYDRLGTAPIVIGHSLGGLLAQKIAAARSPRAVVLMASVPPGVLWIQARVLHHLIPLLPRILTGKPFLPSPTTMRHVPLSTLPVAEQDALVPLLVPDSGRVFRELSFGAPSTRVRSSATTCPVLCVSGGEDRNVAQWISRRIAKRYGAEHQVHPTLPHWIVAPSALDDVAPPILAWLTKTLSVSA